VVVLERGGALADDLPWVRSLNPQAVVTYISPYGLGGPLSDAPATDLTLQSAGGIAWLSGRPEEPPLRLPVEQSVMITSVYAAVATALCLLDAETGGTGHLVDVSAQEAIAHSLQNALQVFDLEGRISRRGGEGTRDASEDIFACKDGAVFLAAPLALGISWKALVAWLEEAGDPSSALLATPAWADRHYRTTAAAKAVFRTAFEGFIRDKTREELTVQAIRRKVVMSPVSRIGDVLLDEQLVYRDFFVNVDDSALGRGAVFPGAPYRLSEPVWRMSAAPGLGQHNDEVLSSIVSA
jgi:benzylsuccinate CoA-transferase BbsE subunit